jgi:hypothetical protein
LALVPYVCAEPIEISIVEFIQGVESGVVETAEFHIPTYKHGIRGTIVRAGKSTEYVTSYVGESDDTLLAFLHANDVRTRRHPKQVGDCVEEVFLWIGPFVLLGLLLYVVVLHIRIQRRSRGTVVARERGQPSN